MPLWRPIIKSLRIFHLVTASLAAIAVTAIVVYAVIRDQSKDDDFKAKFAEHRFSTRSFETGTPAQNAGESYRCRLTVPENAEVLAYGVYHGGVTTQWNLNGDLGSEAHEVAVRLPDGTKDAVLVLTAYKPVIWIMAPETISRVRGVLLSGYSSQAIANLPEAVPLISTSYEHREQSPCRKYAYAFKRSGDRAGGNFTILDTFVRDVTGRNIDRFFSAYTTKAFPLGNRRPHPALSGAIRSVSEVDKPDIPPGRAGIQELVRRGMLRVAIEADIVEWLQAATRRNLVRDQGPVPRSDVHEHSLYTALRNFRIPKGLYGNRSIGLIIPADVTKIHNPGSHTTFYDIADGTRCRSRCALDRAIK